MMLKLKMGMVEPTPFKIKNRKGSSVMEELNKMECNCPHENCRNHGICNACIGAHHQKDSLVYCMRAIAKKKYGVKEEA